MAAFAELLHRVSVMGEDIPEITEPGLNPVFVRQHGAAAADVRIRLTGQTSPGDVGRGGTGRRTLASRCARRRNEQ